MLHLISLDTPLPCTEQLPGNERGANLTFAASHHQEQAPPEAAWQAQDQQQQWRFGLSRFGWGWCADRIRRSPVLAPPPARMRLHAIHRRRELQQATRVQHPPARPTGTSAPPSALSTTSSPSSGNSPTSQPSSAASSTPDRPATTFRAAWLPSPEVLLGLVLLRVRGRALAWVSSFPAGVEAPRHRLSSRSGPEDRALTWTWNGTQFAA